MFRKPALLAREERGDAQRKALLAEQDVSAVAGVDAQNGVVLREVHDIALFLVDFGFGVQALDKIAVAERVEHRVPDAGHNVHVQHNVDRIGQLNAYFGERRADRAHGIGDDIHGAPLHGAVKQPVHHRIGLLRIHPVVRGPGVVFGAGADESSVLNSCNVVDGGAVDIAARQLLLV